MIDLNALGLSLKLATVTSLLLLILSLPLAYCMSRSRSQWTHILESILLLPIVLPPTVLGFYLLYFLSSVHLAFTFSGLLFGSILYSFPFAFQSFLSGFQSIDEDFFEVSSSLGDSHLQTFLRVAIPMARNSILSGVLLSFAHTLGEFGVVLMVGGNIEGQTRTLSISIYDQVQSLDFEKAHATAFFLLIFSFFILMLLGFLRKKRRALR
jgi:molybdate transport system permease protein